MTQAQQNSSLMKSENNKQNRNLVTREKCHGSKARSKVQKSCTRSCALATTDQSLEYAFSQFGDIVDSKIVNDRESRRSRGGLTGVKNLGVYSGGYRRRGSGVYRGCCKGGGDEGYGYREGGGGYGGGGGGYGGGLTSTRVEAMMVAMAVDLAGQLVDVVKLSTIFANLYLSFSQFTMDALIPYYCSLFKNLRIKIVLKSSMLGFWCKIS
ncbi:hypothetical protein LguiB_009537 [Lonicera macranthoides]